jgi:threonine synthase
VTVANLVRFADAGLLDRDERTVAIISGSGYKTIEAVAPTTGPTYSVSPSLDDLRRALGR